VPIRVPANQKSRLSLAVLLVALPPVLFYLTLFRTALNIPIVDDYYAILDFLNEWTSRKTIAEKLLLFVTSQHGELKLFFVHAVALIQYSFLGHANFRILSLLSEGLLIAVAILLWKMFIPKCSNTFLRLMLFVPISWLLFQLQYSPELSVSTPGLQHIGGVLFGLGTIYLIHNNQRRSFLGALVFLVFAIASDGNGFMLIPIGLLMLVLGRRYKRVIIFSAVAIACVVIYAYRLDLHFTQPGTSAPPSNPLLMIALKFLYVLSFMGSAAGMNTHFPAGGLILGVILSSFFIYEIAQGRNRKNALPYYCVLFLLLTAVAAARVRSNFGITQSLAARYALFSILAVIFAWMVIVEEFLLTRDHPLESRIFHGALFCSIFFSLSWDMIGYMMTRARNQEIVAAMARFENPAPDDPEPFPAPRYHIPGPNQAAELKMSAQMRAFMNQSIEFGIYRPPRL
jgi:hypothetical protein